MDEERWRIHVEGDQEWVAAERVDGGILVGDIVCNPPEFVNSRAEWDGRKHLIAAAPDLLAACKALLEDLDATEWRDSSPQDMERRRKIVAQARAAIAKAKGGVTRCWPMRSGMN